MGAGASSTAVAAHAAQTFGSLAEIMHDVSSLLDPSHDKPDEYSQKLSKTERFWLLVCEKFIDPNSQPTSLNVSVVTEKTLLDVEYVPLTMEALTQHLTMDLSPTAPENHSSLPSSSSRHAESVKATNSSVASAPTFGGTAAVPPRFVLRFAKQDEEAEYERKDLKGIVASSIIAGAKNFPIEDAPAPTYFPSATEGRLVCQQLCGKFLPQSETQWSEFLSDESLSHLCFAGLGQLYLTAVDPADPTAAAWHGHGANSKPTSKKSYSWMTLPKPPISTAAAATTPANPLPPQIAGQAAYRVNLSGLGNYEVRAGFERYGCTAFFSATQQPLGIHLAASDSWIFPPLTPSATATATAKEEEITKAKDGTESKKGEEKEDGKKEKQCEGKEELGEQAPAAAAAAWAHAKYVLRCSLFTQVTLRDHLVHCHFMVANTMAMAARQSLSQFHPLRRMLRPHLYSTISVNYAARAVLLPVGGLAQRAFAFTAEAWLQLLEDSVADFRYQPFPQWVAERAQTQQQGQQEHQGPGEKDKQTGTPAAAAALKELPLFADGLAYYEVVHGYVRGYIDIFYPDDAALQADEEVRTFWAHYALQPFFPSFELSTVMDRAALADLLAHGIFWATAGHELLGSVVEYTIDPTGCMATIRPGQAQADLNSFFILQALVGLTGSRRPALLGDWTHLLLHEQLTDEQCEQVTDACAAFQQALQRLSLQLDETNKTRSQPFHKMNPRVLESSVSI